jgi:hypothetical protein
MRWSWRGAVALVLALALGIGWAWGFVITLEHPEELSTGGAALLYGLGGTLVGGVVGWLGGTVRRPGDEEEGRHHD